MTDRSAPGRSRPRAALATALLLTQLAGPALAAAEPHPRRPSAGEGVEDGFEDPAAVRTLDTAHFRVHYAPDTADHADEATAAEVGAVAEEARAVLVDQLGWPAPVPDAGVDGGDLVDVYLLDLPGPQGEPDAPFGYANTHPEDCPACRASPGYVVLDNDFADYGVEPGVALRATLAHEIGHLSHFAMALWMENWAYEATGVWLEQAIFPGSDARSVYLEDFADRPGLPLTDFDSESGGFDRAYGAYVWNLWLAARYGPGVVRTSWKAATRFADHALSGYDAALARHDTSFADEFIAFAAATAAWDLAGFPADAEPYPRVARDADLSSGEVRTIALDHTAYAVADVPAAPGYTVTVRGPRYVVGGVALVAVVGGEVRTVSDSTLRDGQATVSLAGLEDAERVSVVVVNADATLARPKDADSDQADYLAEDVAYVVGVDADPGPPLRR